MGFDCYSRRKTAPEGAHFGCVMQLWPRYWKLMQAANVLPPELLDVMQFNQGEGPTSGKVCKTLADKIESNPEAIAKIVDRYVTKKDVKRFLAFLRHCGGFRVW